MEISRFQFLPVVPAEYILEKVIVSWREIDWAYQHGMFGPAMLVELSKQMKQESVVVVELANLDKDHYWKVPELVAQLIRSEMVIDEELTAKKWLYVVLSFVFDNQSKFEDPLMKVEEIYADFGHPKEISSFVRYMPETDPTYDASEHSQEENLQRLFVCWKRYLDSESHMY